MADQLSKLTKRADAVAESASVLVSRAIREIRGELANLSRELNLAGNADDREGVYDMIRRKMNRLSRNLNKLLVAQNQAAAQGAAKAASDMTGLEIKYSAQRAKAICELVTPAQGENLAAVFTDKMGANMISTLREATVAALRQQAVAGGSMKELSRDMTERWFEAMKNEHPVFTDSAGHEWNTATYFQMNVRTNTMRVYNDCLVDNVARETGSDLMRISTGGDPSCAGCFPWEGCIISVSGKTKGFPTYEDARKGGCFHPNCVHTLEYIDEVADADEIALQKSTPVDPDTADDADAQDERRYEIDQARKMRDEGLTSEQARVAVDRDNLAAQIRHGLLRADAADMVAHMTDEQVTRLCPNGNPPEFVPAKGSKRKPEPEVWNHGSRGGVVHIKRDADLAHILSVTKANAPKTPAPSPKPAPKPAPSTKKSAQTNVAAPVATPTKAKAWTPSTALERATDAQMAAIGAKHTDAALPTSGTNPEYTLSRRAHRMDADGDAARVELKRRGLSPSAFTENCQRCVPTEEARRRGYDVTALPRHVKNDPIWAGCVTQQDYNFLAFKNPQPLKYRSRADIETQMAAWGDGARAQVCCYWKGGHAHTFFAVQEKGKTVFIDPQSNTIGYDPFPQISTRSRAAFRCNEFARIDNLEFSDKIKIACKVTGP